ncbi:shadow of prion protein [Malurus melanocephalus]|uniref:shadow of prion protein n=1 Tax=Malurus melanocephalus TaxID=175006 RepID=UPI002548B2C3|nr:shadow of prion protein [Malurus melanocephalus]
MRRSAAACWALVLLAATFCDTVAGKGGRGGARGAGVAAGAALRRARLSGELQVGDGVEYRDGNWTGAASAWTSAAPAGTPPGRALPWLCPLAALLRR